ncbi:MAG: hypothetical protein IJD86_09020, partial [Clostridia bacterium]|nr:hypothetical protein [Clostridia bacterium]
QPDIVGRNAYGDGNVFGDFRFSAEDALAAFNTGLSQMWDYSNLIGTKSHAWSSDGQITTVILYGEKGDAVLTLTENPFEGEEGEKTGLPRNRELIKFTSLESIQWRVKGLMKNPPRSIDIGASLEQVLSAFDIQEIHENGEMFTPVYVYDQKSMELSGRINIENNGDVTVSLSAYGQDEENYTVGYELIYRLKDDKVTRITLSRR